MLHVFKTLHFIVNLISYIINPLIQRKIQSLKNLDVVSLISTTINLL